MQLNKGSLMKTANPNEVRYCCPSCGDEGYHLYFNILRNIYHCFKCGARGREKPERMYTDEALQEVIDVLSNKKMLHETKHTLILPRMCIEVPNKSRAMSYMHKRGVSTEKVRAMGCMISEDPAYENRIIIPTYDEKGKINFFQARGLYKFVQPKYLNPIHPKRDVLFYSDGKFIQHRPYLFIVEGIFKALKFWEIGEPAVALFGKEITSEQTKIIHNHTDLVHIVLDPDANKFALKMRSEMIARHSWWGCRVLFPPKAPDDMSKLELTTFLREI